MSQESTVAQTNLPVIFLMGPTAAGKTETACRLFDAGKSVFPYDFELINVDSTQVYKGMDIGSAKMSCADLSKYPHHLIDIREPSQPYNVADFSKDAHLLIQQIHQRGKVPLFVGGTMMYFKILREGLADMPQCDEVTRNEILQLAAEKGWPHIHELLSKVDPQSAQRLTPNDKQRLQRSYEVYLTSGKTMTQHYLEQEVYRFPYQLLQLAIYPSDRAKLHENIKIRFHEMLKQGLVDEVKRLRENPLLNMKLPAMRAAGYRQVWQYLDGEITEEQMVELSIIATRQLAKRQITWIRNWDDLVLVHTENDDVYPKVLECISSFIKQ